MWWARTNLLLSRRGKSVIKYVSASELMEGEHKTGNDFILGKSRHPCTELKLTDFNDANIKQKACFRRKAQANDNRMTIIMRRILMYRFNIFTNFIQNSHRHGI